MTRRWDAATEFDDFVRARHGALLRFAYLLTGDSHLAADLVQGRAGAHRHALAVPGPPG
jgi:hypothetical protein